MACRKKDNGKWTFDGAAKDYSTETEARKAEVAFRAKQKRTDATVATYKQIQKF